MTFYDQGVSPAYELPASAILLSHTGTLDTTGHGNGVSRTAQRPGTLDDIVIGLDTSARGISPAFDATQPGSIAGPVVTAPIY